ncbi:MAG: hypothetical protein WCD70_07130, partial [Alphaproteobacteria bacterium]
LLHLDNAHVVGIFGAHKDASLWPSYAERYFSKDYPPDFLKQNSHNIKAQEIAREMKEIGNIITIPREEKHPAFHSLCIPPLAHKADPAKDRYVTLILTSENPEARKAFQNFRQELNKYCY